MDERTLGAYTKGAAGFSQDWLSQPPPEDLYRLFDRFFRKGVPTADIGCGNGRDAAWLDANGYPCAGYEGSEALVAEARRLFPDLAFGHAVLPDLEAIPDDAFGNVVCETVIMHLPRAEIEPALANLTRILRRGGVLCLSWRVTPAVDIRDFLGRLYSAFEPELALAALGGYARLHFEDVAGASSGKRVCRFVGRRL
jgi:SAM-dependent methyltransferase